MYRTPKAIPEEIQEYCDTVWALRRKRIQVQMIAMELGISGNALSYRVNKKRPTHEQVLALRQLVTMKGWM